MESQIKNVELDGKTSQMRYLSFSLGEEEYAIPLLAVREVIAVPEITPVPQTPPYFLGIMNLRGQVISVMDLRTKLNIKPSVKSENAVIIFELSGNIIGSVGVVVDSINCVLSPTLEQMSEKPEIQSQKATDYITGVFREAERLILILDVNLTLSLGDQKAISMALNAKK